ncbi:hypothetical protein [Pseudooctadecabacter sp.]|uniref:hypothetical protein n=1 Tax=Pseudooctadecabacter sp. TaxID=1966338 RepID=UPI0025E457F8|nr:hypothetical protein [Pseudooctadecabacter sp.]
MKHITLITALALAPMAGFATPGNGNGIGTGNGQANGRPHLDDAFCPPGLVDRDLACVPPGQAAKYGIGDDIENLEEDIIVELDGRRYGLSTDRTYYRVNDFVYEVDQDTMEIIAFVDAFDALTN